jgi:hypothetical protein
MFFGTIEGYVSKKHHITFVFNLFTRPFQIEAIPMTIRRSIALVVAAAAMIAVAACSSPTAPKGCDVVSTSGSTC